MKEKVNCKIIQDLLPNYIEKLTNDETNQFVENHLKECEECKKIFENMEKEIKLNDKKIEEREVKYIKKYNNKLRLLRNVLLIIVIVYIIIVGRKLIILTDLSNKANDMRNLTNYHTKTQSCSNGQMTYLESYSKDGITLGKINIFNINKKSIEMIMYKSENEGLGLINNGERKLLSTSSDIKVTPVYFTGENFLENLWIALTTNVDKINLSGKSCYLIKQNNEEKFIDVDTGLAIKLIDNNNNRTTDYYYEFNTVKDSDIEKPDTTGYELSSSILEKIN